MEQEDHNHSIITQPGSSHRTTTIWEGLWFNKVRQDQRPSQINSLYHASPICPGTAGGTSAHIPLGNSKQCLEHMSPYKHSHTLLTQPDPRHHRSFGAGGFSLILFKHTCFLVYSHLCLFSIWIWTLMTCCLAGSFMEPVKHLLSTCSSNLPELTPCHQSGAVETSED